MNLSTGTALGIDISEGQINMALLRQSTKGMELVKTAGGPIPDGAIENGNVADFAALARAIKELKNQNRIRAPKAAVSLSVSPVITHILEIPEGNPRNVGQFVRDELKSCVALSGRDIAFDFCPIKSRQRSGGRLLAVASCGENVTELIKAYIRAGIHIEAVEPEMLAYVRALYARKIEGRFDCNVLIGLLHDKTLTLCAFRKQTLDLVRIEDVSVERSDPDELCRRIAAEINTIIRFYEVEVEDCNGKWEVTLLADRVQLADNAENFLRAETSNSDLEVISDENVYQDMPVDRKGCRERPSALAISLAMGLLNKHETSLKINLVPPESAEVRAVKRQLTLTAAIIIVVIPLLAFLAGQGLSRMADKVHKSVSDKKQTAVSQNTSELLKEQKFLEQQIKLLSKRPDGLNAVLSRRTVDWASILDDVKSRTPESVRITALYNHGETEMNLEGLALSYEAARLFVKMLSESDYVSLASLIEAAREDAAGGLVTYRIECTVKSEKSES